MQTEDHQIDLLEVSSIRQYAQTQRRYLGWEGLDRVDPLSLKAIKQIWTVRGVTPFSLEFVAHDNLRGYRGHTTFDGSRLVTTVSERVRGKAIMGDGHARFVIAGELGHATLRHPETLTALSASFQRREGENDARRILVSGINSMRFQAGVFAAAFLIHDATARGLSSLDEISVQAGIDTLSARVFYEEVHSTMPRP